MQSRLTTLLLLCVVLLSSLAVFGPAGLVVFAFVVALAICIPRPWLLLRGLLWLLVLVLIGLLVPDVGSHPGSRRLQCMNNMHQIGLALHSYYQAYDCFPPAYVADKNGRPMHSWRVLILPYLDYKDLYDRYDFNEPWDGPNNKKLLVNRPRIFACPSDENARAEGITTTSYAAVVGSDAAWQGAKGRRLSDFRGAESTTIMVVEVADTGVNWTEPKDISLDALRRTDGKHSDVTVSSKHGYQKDFFYDYRYFGGVNAAFADGHVAFLPRGCLAPNVLIKCLTIGGCTELVCDAPDYTPSSWDEERRLKWDNCIALAIWLASTGLLLFRAFKSGRQLAAEKENRAGEGTPDEHNQSDEEC